MSWGEGEAVDQREDGIEELVRQNLWRMYPLNQLKDEALARVTATLRIRRHAARSRLYTAGEQPADYFYLLRGCIWLYDNNGVVPQLTIRPDPDQESLPLPYSVPTTDRAEVVEESIVLHLDRAMLTAALNRPELDFDSVPEDLGASPLHFDDPGVRASATINPPGARATPGAGAAPKAGSSAASPAKAGAAATAGAAKPSGPKPRLRVLVVEDDAEEAGVYRNMLTSLGFKSDWVRNSEEAIELLEIERYGTVLLDVHLPGDDGFTVVQLIRERFHGSKRPRIIALTETTFSGDRGACHGAGMDDQIAKPLSRGALYTKLVG